MNLYPYQERLIQETAIEIGRNNRRTVLVQAPTGSGKTVIMASIAHRYWQKNHKRILILVHRMELSQQILRTLKLWYGIEGFEINADTRTVLDRGIYVAMVETAHRRIIKNANFLPAIGMVFIDERHLGDFNKIHAHFDGSSIIGFSATPLAANKKHPLKNYFETIVCGPQIQELIKSGALVQNHTYSIKGIDRKKLKVTRGEFDEKFMADEYSKLRNVQNTIKSYELISPKTKAICYNCNIQHSKVMLQAWKDAGYATFHVDGKTPDDERKYIFKQFKETPKSILNNVGIATMGTDEPSVETIIVNRSTTSPVLAMQIGGRGGRIYPGKEFFTILDMGGNYVVHGDWNSDRDWANVFWNPPKPRQKLGAQPVKDCPNCMGIIPIQCTTCPLCSYEFPHLETVYDHIEVNLELVTKNIDVEDLIIRYADKKPYYSLMQIVFKVGTYIKYRSGGRISDQTIKDALERCNALAAEWCKLKGKEFDRRDKWLVKKTLYETLDFEPNKNNNYENAKM